MTLSLAWWNLGFTRVDRRHCFQDLWWRNGSFLQSQSGLLNLGWRAGREQNGINVWEGRFKESIYICIYLKESHRCAVENWIRETVSTLSFWSLVSSASTGFQIYGHSYHKNMRRHDHLDTHFVIIEGNWDSHFQCPFTLHFNRLNCDGFWSFGLKFWLKFWFFSHFTSEAVGYI